MMRTDEAALMMYNKWRPTTRKILLQTPAVENTCLCTCRGTDRESMEPQSGEPQIHGTGYITEGGRRWQSRVGFPDTWCQCKSSLHSSDTWWFTVFKMKRIIYIHTHVYTVYIYICKNCNISCISCISCIILSWCQKACHVKIDCLVVIMTWSLSFQANGSATRQATM